MSLAPGVKFSYSKIKTITRASPIKISTTDKLKLQLKKYYYYHIPHLSTTLVLPETHKTETQRKSGGQCVDYNLVEEANQEKEI